MVQKVRVLLVDDLDGGDGDETVGFVLDGTAYEIDLSEKHAEELRDVFAPYVAVARKVGKTAKLVTTNAAARNPRGPYKKGPRLAETPEPPRNEAPESGRARRRLPDGKERNLAIRNWAKTVGLPVGEKGRIAQPIQDRFDAEWTG